jgi:predicted DCC family thiol-disulfide oxidoreductase YuxK
MTEAALVLFDGDGNVGNATVRFITAHEEPGRFRFAVLREPEAAASSIVIDDAGLHERSSAALRERADDWVAANR